ncbi:MAG: polymerase subunit alpha [Actinomycetota bacterium]|jgi:DNA polymerase-3 subunit alpha
MTDSFVHLHVHTDNSMLDGAARIDPLLDAAVAQGMPAIAMTDHGTLFGAFEFWKKANDRGIKPIIGIEAYLAPESRLEKRPIRWGDGGEDDVSGGGAYTHLTLLSETTEGMHNLFTLSSSSYIEGFYQHPRMDVDILSQNAKGLIATSGCVSGEVQTRIRMGQYDEAKKVAATMRDIFGKENYFIEIMDHGIAIERRGIKDLLRLAKELDLPLVLTNDLHYVNHGDFSAHEALLCVQSGSTLLDEKRFKFETDQFYLKSAAEMRRLFPDHPEAADNTLLIAERCGVQFDTSANHMPHFPVESNNTEEKAFERAVWAGLEERYGKDLSPEIRERAAYEIDIITTKGFAGYYLIVADFTGWARANGVRVGPGRGSGAGSIAAYAMRITDLEPLEHGLLFERFLNPERESMPDFDIDFSTKRRDDVKRYVTEKYGSDYVAQIATYNIIKAKQALKDSARVLGYPYEVGDRLTKAVPPMQLGRDMSLGEMFDKDNPRFKEAAQFREVVEGSVETKTVYETARGIEKIKRNTGVHAAGVIMSDTKLSDIVPLMMRSNDGQIITQFDYPTCEALGLIKMDFLGLRNLDILDDALINIQRNRGETLVLEDLTYDDPKVYELLSTGETLGIFQLDSPPMRQLLKQMQPDSFEDISAVLALYRPGPMAMKSHTNYAMRKQGMQTVTPIHKELAEPLSDILDPTYGLIVYQEQVMQIAQRVAGYSLAQADNLRRAMGKKKKEVLDKEFGPFSAGMLERGYSKNAIDTLWEILVPFSDYAFNKSHSAAYGVVAYFTAYLKAHYPQEFLAGLLTSVGDDRDKLGGYLVEARRMGVKVLAPDINESVLHFAAVGEDVRFGLGSIKNVGEGVVDHIVGERDANGPYTSFQDFLDRVPLPALQKRTLEALIKAGAFDRFDHTRRALLDVHEKVVEDATRSKKDASKGDIGFDFGELFDEPVVLVPERPEWPRKTKLEFERDMLGLYVSDHPLNGQENSLSRAANILVGDLQVAQKMSESEDADAEYELIGANEGDQVTFAGLLRNVEMRVARTSGKPFAMAMLEDMSGSITVSVLGRAYDDLRMKLVNDTIVAVTGRIRLRENAVSLMASEIREIEATNVSEVGIVKVQVPAAAATTTVIAELDEILKRHPGNSEVELRVRHPDSVRVFTLPHRVEVSGALYGELRRVLGPNALA